MRTVIAATVAATLAASVSAFGQDVSATAAMKSADGEDAGTVTFKQAKSGMVHLVVEMTGLPPGPHGFHIHETGACEGDFESAGGHYAGGKEHGFNVENGPHAGDFPNVHVAQDGLLKIEFVTDRVSLGEGGDNPLKDQDGSAVVVHAEPDDYEGQPSGNAGDRIACGVIE